MNSHSMSRGPRWPRSLRIGIGAVLAAAALALGAGPAVAAEPPEYNSIPAVLPGNVVSFAFEAQQATEMGDYIELAGTERASINIPVTIIMSSWGCETGGMATCATTPGATWKQSLTLTIYNVVETPGNPPAVGSVVLTTTQDFNIPYRPSADSTGHCPASDFYPWYSASADHCYNGLAHAVTFYLPAGKTLPTKLIWGIAYNTQHYGANPVGTDGPWNSLNVGTQTFDGQPTYGTDVEPNGAFVAAGNGVAYGDKGANGLNTFRDDTGTVGFPAGQSWVDYKPLACFGTTCPQAEPAPVSSVLAETGAPHTPPPTSTSDTSGGRPGPGLALLVCSAFAAVALLVVGSQRRSIRR